MAVHVIALMANAHVTIALAKINLANQQQHQQQPLMVVVKEIADADAEAIVMEIAVMETANA